MTNNRRRKIYRLMKQSSFSKKPSKASLKDLIYLGIITLVLIGPVTSLNNFVPNATEGITQVQAATDIIIEPSPVERVEKTDDRVSKLEKFLKTKNSPLAPYSKAIVTNADYYGIGWTDIVAISSIESNYCNKTIPGSYNCWGLGGDKNFMTFGGYIESITYMSKLIGTDYIINKNQGMQPKYCPTESCNNNWPSTVTASSKEILGQ